MSLTYSPEVAFGTLLPEFSLLGMDGQNYSKKSFLMEKPLLVMFICNHCPYVQAIEERILTLARKYISSSVPQSPVQFLAICSNDPTDYPEDSYESLRKNWQQKKFPFPYLHDPTQKAAHAFGAVCTPDFFLYDQKQKLVYRGRLDDSWKDSKKVRKQELAEAIDTLLQGGSLDPLQQRPSMGCSIKFTL
ncbi:MAG: thioredoxin family protein [Bdellovibrionales bacterium]|nr:thioredoxin family protein [Bdellovibrionales bacterium]